MCGGEIKRWKLSGHNRIRASGDGEVTLCG
jgi:hypothetical protein